MNAMLQPESAAPVAAAADVDAPVVPARRPRRPLAANSTSRVRQQVSATVMKIVAPLLGAALLVLVWQIITIKNASFPTPLATLQEAIKLFSDPFYSKSPNDQGIGWNILASLQRVAVGFGLAALVGIPLGFLIGRVQFVGSMFGPIISLLKPVSPLAWLPIGLLVFKSANPAAI